MIGTVPLFAPSDQKEARCPAEFAKEREPHTEIQRFRWSSTPIRAKSHTSGHDSHPNDSVFTVHLSLFTFQIRCDPGLNSSLMIADEKFHHSVYVILLDPVTLGLPSIVRFNPNRDPAKPCVYVGMTGLPVEQRFENHKKGVKAAWVVKKYGIRLMPELYEYLNPMPFEAAAQMEKDLAADLRAEGYTVTGGT